MGGFDAGPGLTPAELDVIESLSRAWNRFIGLGDFHPDDLDEFRRAIHSAQCLVAYRVARRVDPDVWVADDDAGKPVIEPTRPIDELTHLSPDQLEAVRESPIVGLAAWAFGRHRPG